MAYDEKLAERMRAKLKSTKGLAEKKVFGGVGFLVNGNMSCGVNKQDMIGRLGDDDFAAALKQPHVRIFDMTGRPIKGWILISAEGLAGDKALQYWIDKSVSFARSLPPK